jgi:hypothetical protein
MKGNQDSTTLANFIAYALTILIGLYMTASTIASFIPVNQQAFTIVFTLAGGIPALTILFKEKYAKNKQPQSKKCN